MAAIKTDNGMNNKCLLKRISYGTNNNQFGDLRIPVAGEGPFPLAVIIHGGFWKKQFGLEQMNDFAEKYASHGIATWNIEYRRVGQDGGGWPGTFLDSARSIESLKIIAEDHPVDLKRVIIIGHSAGGHLALWLAARNKLLSNSILRQQDRMLEPKGVISLAGVSDLILMYEIHQWKEKLFGVIENPTRDLIGGKPNEYAQRYAEGSPKELLPIGIPLVLFHGALDVNVPIGLSVNFKKIAESAGDNVVLKTFPNIEHFELIDPMSEVWSIIWDHTVSLLNNT
ncbi:S9 family peptidase [Alteribacillus sp. YIM 98480]|uniref:alpha/beta hydrolase family protein n=1 Tax=Alteribacillus sp. YIM 98480 TaxID=2606599 RepID=UPI001E416AAC|nr:alpha/beta hydrolase [Alteribacillus sp. YIM 98480]